MRHSFVVLSLAALAAATGCQSSRSTQQADHESTTSISKSSSTGAAGTATAPPHTAIMYVHGMGCPQCANNVDSQLMRVPGVESVAIDMGSGKVTAKLSPSQHPTRDQLAKAIDNTGFTLVKIEMPQ